MCDESLHNGLSLEGLKKSGSSSLTFLPLPTEQEDFYTNSSYSRRPKGEFRAYVNEPAAYVKNITVKVRPGFVAPYMNIDSCYIRATSSDFLGNLAEQKVKFYRGQHDRPYYFQAANNTVNYVAERTVTWQWKVRDINGSGSSEVNFDTSGPHTIYVLLGSPKSPMTEPWTEILDYGCDWASGKTYAYSVCNDILNNGFKQHYTWDWNCTCLVSDFVYLVTSLGVTAVAHHWQAYGGWPRKVGAMAMQKTILVSPVGRPDLAGQHQDRWRSHWWARAAGYQWDPSLGKKKVGSGWGAYEDHLYEDYGEFWGTGYYDWSWVGQNYPGQTVGCESLADTNCTHEEAPTEVDLPSNWTGPTR